MIGKLYTYTTFTAYLLLHSFSLLATNDSISADKKLIYTFTLNQEIMPAALRTINNAIDEASELKADYIIMQLNTFGGRVDIADSIRMKLLDAKPTVIVFIDKNAASAGALISIACDSIYMTKGASIGAATVVSGTDGQQMPDKYQSYMRSTMRSTAEAQGRDPRIAEAMVDDRIKIEGIIDSAYTLTFTTGEAIEHGFCEGQVESITEIITEKLAISNYEIVNYEPGALEPIISFLLNPLVNSILLLLIFGGLYFELQTPGVGFPLIAAIVGAVLYFAPLYLEGLAENWEILLFIAGLVLLALEIFVIPGFGVAGISGIILVVAGLTLALVQNVVFDFSLTGFDALGFALIRVVGIVSFMLFIVLAFGKRIFTSKAFTNISLADSQLIEDGYTSHDTKLDSFIGKVGVCHTDLRPSGMIIIESERLNASSDGEFIVKDTEVEVYGVNSNTLMVKRSKQS